MEGKPLTILLVEDEEAHAVIVKRNFNDFNLANNIFHDIYLSFLTFR